MATTKLDAMHIAFGDVHGGKLIQFADARCISKLDMMDILEHIDMRNSITYVGIGCACYTDWKIEENQQYPIFIRNYKKYNEDIKVNLILIDPCISSENILAHCGSQGKIDNQFGNIITTNDNITIYFFTDRVEYAPPLTRGCYLDANCINPIKSLFGQYESTYASGSMTIPQTTHMMRDMDTKRDITILMRRLNDECVFDSGVLIVHDFSGNDICVMDKYFNDYTARYPERILYDLSDGTQCGCFLDMADPINHVFFNVNCGSISMSNPKKISPFLLKHTNSQNISTDKINRIKKSALVEFSKYFHNYRRAMLWCIDSGNMQKSQMAKRTISIRDIVIFDIVNKTNLVDCYVNDDIKKYVDISRRLYEMRKCEIENIYDTKIILSPIMPNVPMDSKTQINTGPTNWGNEMSDILHNIDASCVV